MSEIEIAEIKARLTDIREDIAELKESHKKIVEIIAKLSSVEDKFSSNNEAHKLMWEEIKTMRHKCNNNDYVTKSDIRVIGAVLTIVMGIVSFVINVLAKWLIK